MKSFLTRFTLVFSLSVLMLSGAIAQGPQLLKDIRSGSEGSDPLQLKNVGGMLFFVADDGVLGREPWISDGSTSGTVILEDIHPTTALDYNRTTIYDAGTIYFLGEEGTFGREVYKSNGSGAELMVDVYEGNQSSFFEGFTNPSLAILDGDIFMNARDGSGAPGTVGTELWKSDGTSLGTELVKDINPGPNSSLVGGLTEYNGRLYFSANNGSQGFELWTTDGTETGTFRLKDINSGSGHSFPTDFTVAGAYLYFLADDGSHGIELWRTDGTEPGTELVQDIWTGSSASGITELAALDNKLFFNAEDGSNGIELWVTEGPGSTNMIELNAGAGSSSPGSFAVANGQMFFHADNGTDGSELWVSDGRADGTEMVMDVASGADGSFPDLITPYENVVYFAASSPDGDLWCSDGTAVGTYAIVEADFHGIDQVQDIELVGGELYFTANGFDVDGENVGVELFRMDDIVSVEDDLQSENHVQLYPIPSTGNLYFTGLNDINYQGAEVLVYDISGKLLMQDTLSGNNIDLKNLTDGTYIIRIQSDKTHIERKVIISH